MNFILKLANRFLRRKSSSQKNIKLISNSIKLSNPSVSGSSSKIDEFSQHEWESRIKELHKALENAARNAEEFKAMIESAKSNVNDELVVKTVAKQIISACDQISLNGLRLLAGDEIGLKIRSESINIKLPDSAARGFGLSSGANLNEAEQDLAKLTEAIKASQAEVSRCQDKLLISRHNLKSAGIDLSTVEGLMQ